MNFPVANPFCVATYAILGRVNSAEIPHAWAALSLAPQALPKKGPGNLSTLCAPWARSGARWVNPISKGSALTGTNSQAYPRLGVLLWQAHPALRCRAWPYIRTPHHHNCLSVPVGRNHNHRSIDWRWPNGRRTLPLNSNGRPPCLLSGRSQKAAASFARVAEPFMR
jgi:hypothetical protein